MRNNGPNKKQETRNGTVVTATESNKARKDMPKLLVCLVLVGISWAMVICNIVINTRNGQ
jgi:hypothetical protein